MKQTAYQIKVQGQLDPRLSAWFDEWVITHTADGNTLLTGTGIDQAALYGVLTRCRDLGLTLVSINSLTGDVARSQAAAKPQKEITMKTVHVEYSQIFDATPETIYAVLADYRGAHLAILPRQYFAEVTIEKGGHGAGTVTNIVMKLFGKTYTYHQVVTEPEPGRVIVETDTNSEQYTTFTIDPVNSGKQTRLTVTSEFPGQGGLAGFIARLFQPPVVRQIYKTEMKMMADYLSGNALVTSTIGAR